MDSGDWARDRRWKSPRHFPPPTITTTFTSIPSLRVQGWPPLPATTWAMKRTRTGGYPITRMQATSHQANCTRPNQEGVKIDPALSDKLTVQTLPCRQDRHHHGYTRLLLHTNGSWSPSSRENTPFRVPSPIPQMVSLSPLHPL
jgi:hypothetical protein